MLVAVDVYRMDLRRQRQRSLLIKVREMEETEECQRRQEESESVKRY